MKLSTMAKQESSEESEDSLLSDISDTKVEFCLSETLELETSEKYRREKQHASYSIF